MVPRCRNTHDPSPSGIPSNPGSDLRPLPASVPFETLTVEETMFPNQPGLDQMREQQERMRQQQQDLRNRQMADQWQKTHGGTAPPPLPSTGPRPGVVSRFLRWIIRLTLWFAGVGLLVYAGFAALGEEWSFAAGGLVGALVLFLLRRPLRWR